MQSRRLKSWALFVSLGVAVGFALAAPISPWYTISSDTAHWTIQNSTFSLSGTTTFFPGSNYRFACNTLPVTAPIWGSICVETKQASGGIPQPYAASLGHGSSALGPLYSMVWLLTTAAFSLGALGLTLLVDVTRRRRPDWRYALGAALALVVAGSLALGAGIGVASLQPAAVSQDFGGLGSPAQAGAGSSFWGSCGPSPVQCGGLPSGNLTENNQWGPAFGWYLEVAAGALFITVGAIVLRQALSLRSAHDPHSSRQRKP